MTGPANTTKQLPQKSADKNPSDAEPAGRDDTNGPATESGDQLDELARTQEDIAHQARQLVARQLTRSEPNGHDDERGDRVLLAAQQDLLTELRNQEQERAQRQLAEATRSGEDAVAGMVQGITTIVRSIVPAALVRPQDVIEATYALADQGLRVGRRLALTVTSSMPDPRHTT